MNIFVNKNIVPNIWYALVLTSDLLTAANNRPRPATNQTAIDKGNRRPTLKTDMHQHHAQVAD